MSSIASKVLTTVNAPYVYDLNAQQLAGCLSDISAAKSAVGPTYAFFSEVPPELQKAFVAESNLDPDMVSQVAQYFSELSGQQFTAF